MNSGVNTMNEHMEGDGKVEGESKRVVRFEGKRKGRGKQTPKGVSVIKFKGKQIDNESKGVAKSEDEHLETDESKVANRSRLFVDPKIPSAVGGERHESLVGIKVPTDGKANETADGGRGADVARTLEDNKGTRGANDDTPRLDFLHQATPNPSAHDGLPCARLSSPHGNPAPSRTSQASDELGASGASLLSPSVVSSVALDSSKKSNTGTRNVKVKKKKEAKDKEERPKRVVNTKNEVIETVGIIEGVLIDGETTVEADRLRLGRGTYAENPTPNVSTILQTNSNSCIAPSGQNQHGYKYNSTESSRLGGNDSYDRQASPQANERSPSQSEGRKRTHLLQVFNIGGDSDAEIASDSELTGNKFERPPKLGRFEETQYLPLQNDTTCSEPSRGVNGGQLRFHNLQVRSRSLDSSTRIRVLCERQQI